MLNSLNLSGALAYSIIKSNNLKKSIIVPMQTDEDANDILESITTISRLLSYNTLPVLIFSQTDIFSRLNTISKISDNKNVILCASVAALEKKTFTPADFNKSVITIRKNDKIDRENLISQLADNGYERTDTTTDAGEFSVRGEILDVWSVSSDFPFRLVFNVNTIESIKSIDAASQRSINALEEAVVIPSAERAEAAVSEYLGPDSYNFQESDVIAHLPSANYGGDIELFKERFKQWQDDGFQIFVAANNDGERQHLIEILGASYERYVFTGSLVSGFVSKEEKIVFVTTNEIYSRYKTRIRAPKYFKELGEPVESLADIKKNDYVVHERYGIGIYNGLKRITAGGITAEYIAILYADNDKLFVPVDDFNRIQKYFSVSQTPPKIYHLDSTSWEKTKANADENARKLAQQLLQIYSERFSSQREPFISNSDYERKFEQEFLYDETPDQKKAIEDIMSDMTGYTPMERCIFGDTGFGKTEVAMRAALKSVLSGRQVCLLAPTTVLVEQHGQTFSERFADWPVKIDTLSRFKTKKQQKLVVEKLKSGEIDVVIGTHRLLSRDIAFKNLGLLIIDEEHRFGVADKEKIKSLKKNVDYLCLTATPIPRTLSMALAGIRNMSSIETPPLGRQSVETKLLEYDDNIVADSIMFEVSRGGQIFFIHNRVGTIESIVAKLKKILPLVRFDFLHGRMSPAQIEDKMLKFLNKQFDCLISTTIIEAGLDIPNVNTIIVEEAENFGLGQLYQLRGRVGRSKTKAYCYLFYKKENLTDIAEKRLSAIREFAKLGSGLRLAIKDLQIRGAGDILGKRQHGYVDSIGFDMYMKLLERHSNEIRGVSTEEEITPEINIPVDAVIDEKYVADENLRIGFYKKIITALNPEVFSRIKSEMEDRFGRVPEEVENLFRIGEIRLLAKELGIQKISFVPPSLTLRFLSRTTVEPTKIMRVLKGGKFRFVKSDLLEVSFDSKIPAEKNLKNIKIFLQSLKE